jgi:hypothetical protein
MSSTGAGESAGTAEDQAYFRALEERFLALRGRATLLSAEDWATAVEWRRTGIPLELVTAEMERLFVRQRERRSRRGISSLRYFSAAVHAAWSERLEAGAGGARPLADPGPPVEARLAALARALPAGLAGRAALERRILELTGSFEEVETALGEIDRETLAGLARTLGPEEEAALRARVDRALAAALAASPARELAEARERLYVRALRERFDLPLLSLFSPLAMGPSAD